MAAEILDEFLAADTIVIGAPLYNFTVSSQLKAWIDRILIRGRTFRYGDNGPEGLAGGKRVIVGLARGGLYGEGSPFADYEHAETLLRGVFTFIGIPNAEFIIAEGLATGEEARRNRSARPSKESRSLHRNALRLEHRVLSLRRRAPTSRSNMRTVVPGRSTRLLCPHPPILRNDDLADQPNVR